MAHYPWLHCRTIEFDAIISAARGAAASGDHAAENKQLTLAADLYTDDLLIGVYDEWLRPNGIIIGRSRRRH